MSHDRGVCYADYTHVEPEGEPYAACYVYDVDGDGYDHRYYCVLHAREPSVEAEEHDTRGHGPDAGEEVCGDEVVAVHYPYGGKAYGSLEYEDAEADDERDEYGACEHECGVLHVAGAESLCREAACAHTDESAVPIYEVEYRDSYGQSAYGCGGSAPLSGYDCSGDTHDGYGDVRDDVG